MRKDGFRRPDEASLRAVLEQVQGTMAETILRLAWNLGLFREEMHQLTWNDVSVEEGLVRLPERSIPMDEEVQQCLRARYAQRGHLSPFVVTSDRNRKPMAPQSIARCARVALDAGGLTDINLVDLRHDFTIRQLQQHDWPYVARISGIAVSTLCNVYAPYLPRRSGAPVRETEPRETPPRAIRLAGGAARSPVWAQIFADVMGIPVETVNVNETGALGCAISAAAATGAYATVAEAAENMSAPSAAVMPIPAHRAVYEKKYALYRKTIECLDPLWEQMQALVEEP